MLQEEASSGKIVKIVYKCSQNLESDNMSVGLVLEGGGMRGIYTAGALEVLMENKIRIPYVVAVSAGACNATAYVAGQKRRNYTVLTKYVKDKRYMSVYNLRHKKSLFDFDFVLDALGKEIEPLDWESFFSSSIRFYTGATNIITAKPVYFEKECYKDNFLALRASCSQPFLAPVVYYRGMRLLDGGISDPIPIQKSIHDGNDKNIIIMTRHNGYQKKKELPERVVRHYYKQYPHLVAALNRRAQMYNKRLAYCERLEKEGKAIIIRPEERLAINRCEKNIKNLNAAYRAGIRDMKKKLEQIKAWIE